MIKADTDVPAPVDGELADGLGLEPQLMLLLLDFGDGVGAGVDAGFVTAGAGVGNDVAAGVGAGVVTAGVGVGAGVLIVGLRIAMNHLSL